MDLNVKLAALDARLRGYKQILVAFSGGADSAFLLAAAARSVGAGNTVAATAISPSLAATELEPAKRFAAGLGVRHLTPHTHEMDREGYRANAGDRCYFCKAELMDVLGPLAAEAGIDTVATGTNADDAIAGFRPGIRAAAERGAVVPLRDAGFTKADVRAASAAWGLATSAKPAAACLSSRIAYGVQITPARLARVDRAEQAVRGVLGLNPGEGDVRVRDLDGTASIELGAELLAAVPGDDPHSTEPHRADRHDGRTGAGLRTALLTGVRSAGFADARIDPRGFRSGSMNEQLAEPELYR